MGGIKTNQDLEDFVNGAALYGCGGGGTPSVGMDLLKEVFVEGDLLEFEDINNFNDDDWLCTAWYMGSIAPPSDEEKEIMKERGQIDRKVTHFLARAVEELEKEMNITFVGIMAEELGGINSPAPLAAAVKLKKRFIDGDLVGRGVPEVSIIYPRVLGLPMCPVTCCDVWGNVCVIKESHGYDMAEALGKMLSIPAGEPIGLAGFAMQVKDAKRAIIQGTMTNVLKIGSTVREAIAKEEDPAEAFAKASNGKVFFRGAVESLDWESKNGYMYGYCNISGIQSFKGDNLRTWFKNENHVAWLNDKPCALSPDIIQIIDERSGKAIMNDQLKAGMLVAVIAIPHQIYRTEDALKVLGPVHFGYGHIPYKPVEELLDFSIG